MAIGLVVRMLKMHVEARAAAQVSANVPVDKPADEPDRAPAVDPPVGTVRPGWRDLARAIPAVRWREAGVLLSGIGLIAWCIYLWRNFGDPLAFFTVQDAPGWSQGGGPTTWFKLQFAREVLRGPLDVSLRVIPQALMCLIAILLLPRVWRRFGWGYAAYSLVVLAIPIIGTKDFMGTGRYVLAAFPVIAVAGDYLAGTRWRWLRPVVLVVMALGLVGATIVYASGVEVS